MEKSSEGRRDSDPCKGFSTTYKAKLSITSITWTKSGNISVNALSTSNDSDNSKNNKNHHCFGIFLTVLSAIVFSFNALLAKFLSHLHPFNLGIWTFLSMSLLASLLVIYQWKVTKNKNIFSELCPSSSESGRIYGFLFLRSFCGVSALILFFYAVKFITVADAIVIDASSPIFVYLMAFLFLGEKFGFLSVFTTILAFCGVALIARPPIFNGDSDYNSSSIVGAALSFLSMICISISIISIKFLEMVDQSIVNLAVGLWGTVQCVVISWIFGVFEIPRDQPDIFRICGIAVLFYLGQALLMLALKYEDAGPVGLVRTTEVVFIFIWQFLFLGLVPDVYSWSGAFLILLGVAITLLKN